MAEVFLFKRDDFTENATILKLLKFILKNRHSYCDFYKDSKETQFLLQLDFN